MNSIEEKNKDYYNDNENKSSKNEIGEKPNPINEGASLPNISGKSNIYSKESQKQKKNEDKSIEGVEEGSLFESSILSIFEA